MRRTGMVGSGSEREEERGPGADGAFGPDRAAVAMDDAPDRRQAHAGAFEVRFRVQPPEGLEESSGGHGVETGAVVPDENGAASGIELCGADLDARRLPLGGEFPGIAEQV